MGLGRADDGGRGHDLFFSLSFFCVFLFLTHCSPVSSLFSFRHDRSGKAGGCFDDWRRRSSLLCTALRLPRSIMTANEDDGHAVECNQRQPIAFKISPCDTFPCGILGLSCNYCFAHVPLSQECYCNSPPFTSNDAKNMSKQPRLTPDAI
nr:hypothetical protein CFP56_70780 [Quercus suber]